MASLATLKIVLAVQVAIGDQVLDLSVLESEGLLSLNGGPYFDQSTLNAFIDSGRDNWTKARTTIQSLLSSDNSDLRDNADLQKGAVQASRRYHASTCSSTWLYRFLFIERTRDQRRYDVPRSKQCPATQLDGNASWL